MVWDGFAGLEKIVVLEGGRHEMELNNCFEDLEGRVGLKSVWKFVPKAGKKEECKSEGEQ